MKESAGYWLGRFAAFICGLGGWVLLLVVTVFDIGRNAFIGLVSTHVDEGFFLTPIAILNAYDVCVGFGYALGIFMLGLAGVFVLVSNLSTPPKITFARVDELDEEPVGPPNDAMLELRVTNLAQEMRALVVWQNFAEYRNHPDARFRRASVGALHGWIFRQALPVALAGGATAATSIAVLSLVVSTYNAAVDTVTFQEVVNQREEMKTQSIEMCVSNFITARSGSVKTGSTPLSTEIQLRRILSLVIDYQARFGPELETSCGGRMGTEAELKKCFDERYVGKLGGGAYQAGVYEEFIWSLDNDGSPPQGYMRGQEFQQRIQRLDQMNAPEAPEFLVRGVLDDRPLIEPRARQLVMDGFVRSYLYARCITRGEEVVCDRAAKLLSKASFVYAAPSTPSPTPAGPIPDAVCLARTSKNIHTYIDRYGASSDPESMATYAKELCRCRLGIGTCDQAPITLKKVDIVRANSCGP